MANSFKISITGATSSGYTCVLSDFVLDNNYTLLRYNNTGTSTSTLNISDSMSQVSYQIYQNLGKIIVCQYNTNTPICVVYAYFTGTIGDKGYEFLTSNGFDNYGSTLSVGTEITISWDSSTTATTPYNVQIQNLINGMELDLTTYDSISSVYNIDPTDTVTYKVYDSTTYPELSLASFNATIATNGNVESFKLGDTIYTEFPATVKLDRNYTTLNSNYAQGNQNRTITIDYTGTTTPVITDTPITGLVDPNIPVVDI